MISLARLIVSVYVVLLTIALIAPTDWLLSFVGGDISPMGNLEKNDKLVHFSTFALLAFLLSFSIGNPRSSTTIVLALLICGAYGLATEIAQGAFGWRDCDMNDLVADMAGSLLGLIVARFIAPEPIPRRVVARQRVSL